MGICREILEKELSRMHEEKEYISRKQISRKKLVDKTNEEIISDNLKFDSLTKGIIEIMAMLRSYEL